MQAKHIAKSTQIKIEITAKTNIYTIFSFVFVSFAIHWSRRVLLFYYIEYKRFFSLVSVRAFFFWPNSFRFNSIEFQTQCECIFCPLDCLFFFSFLQCSHRKDKWTNHAFRRSWPIAKWNTSTIAWITPINTEH